MKKSMQGFTLVELIIVMVGVGILSTIGLLSWNAVTVSSRDRTREADTRTWVASFDLYKSRFVAWPVLPSADGVPGAKGVCLGTPTSGNGNCVQYGSASAAQYISTTSGAAATDFNTLKTEIARVGNVPVNTSPITKNAAVGPFVFMWQTTSGTAVTVNAAFMNFFENSCPTDFQTSAAIIASNPANYSGLTTLLAGLPSGVNACGIVKTLTYDPNA